jgi:hypothetical protein
MNDPPNWRVFMDRIDGNYWQWGKNYVLPFPDDCAPPDNDEAAN